jgi:hypothetical protein
LMATRQVSMGDVLSIDWGGAEERLEFRKEAEGPIVANTWRAAAGFRKLAVTRTSECGVSFPLPAPAHAVK